MYPSIQKKHLFMLVISLGLILVMSALTQPTQAYDTIPATSDGVSSTPHLINRDDTANSHQTAPGQATAHHIDVAASHQNTHASTTATRIANHIRNRINHVKTQAERVDAIKTHIEAEKTAHSDHKSTFQPTTQTRLTNLAANLSNQMDVTINRIQNIIDRLNSRIGKIKATGVNTDEGEANIVTAQQSLDQATSIINSIDTDVASFIISNNPHDSWKSLKQTYRDARDDIKTSHRTLIEAVTTLKTAIYDNGTNNGVSDVVSANARTTTTSTTDNVPAIP